ncbi:MAG: lasso peptide biosynthesis B2 protein [Xanthobacteraceae bacterium]
MSGPAHSPAKRRNTALRSLRRRLVRFAQVGPHRRAVLVEAVAWLLVARLSLIFVSFPHLARRLGTLVAPADARALRAGSDNKQDQTRVAEEVGWAVTRAARHVPFNAVCLPQAMAARIMLKRRGVDSVLHFGARIGQGRSGQDKPIDAHAWLDAAGVEVTGYPVANTFAEIACFV